VEDVTICLLVFSRTSVRQHPEQLARTEKNREMTIVGSQRMIVYDDLRTREKIRIYDVRVERPPHYERSPSLLLVSLRQLYSASATGRTATWLWLADIY